MAAAHSAPIYPSGDQKTTRYQHMTAGGLWSANTDNKKG
jgi:hypothetical protein